MVGRTGGGQTQPLEGWQQLGRSIDLELKMRRFSWLSPPPFSLLIPTSARPFRLILLHLTLPDHHSRLGRCISQLIPNLGTLSPSYPATFRKWGVAWLSSSYILMEAIVYSSFLQYEVLLKHTQNIGEHNLPQTRCLLIRA